MQISFCKNNVLHKEWVAISSPLRVTMGFPLPTNNLANGSRITITSPVWKENLHARVRVPKSVRGECGIISCVLFQVGCGTVCT